MTNYFESVVGAFLHVTSTRVSQGPLAMTTLGWYFLHGTGIDHARIMLFMCMIASQVALAMIMLKWCALCATGTGTNQAVLSTGLCKYSLLPND